MSSPKTSHVELQSADAITPASPVAADSVVEPSPSSAQPAPTPDPLRRAAEMQQSDGLSTSQDSATSLTAAARTPAPLPSGSDSSPSQAHRLTRDEQANDLEQRITLTRDTSSSNTVAPAPSDDASALADQLNTAQLSSSETTAAQPISAPALDSGDSTPSAPADHHAQPAPPPLTVENEEQWPLKAIAWPPLPPPPSSADGSHIETSATTIKIICQNRNGPCSLIALCNILILRHEITITPASRSTVSYSYLAQLVANHLLRSSTATPAQLESVLEILPQTRYGLTVNPQFGHVDGFRQSGESAQGGTGELALFALSKVPLIHGWLPDPQDHETWDAVVGTAGDYDRATELLVEATELGAIPGDEMAQMSEEQVVRAVERRSKWTAAEEDKARKADAIRRFLATSPTQLTYHGLFVLSTHLAPSSLAALFRNSHLSVLLRRPSTPDSTSGPQLFTLVTDESFANEPGVVWESLEDVEGGLADFYDGALRRTGVRGGDYVSGGRQQRDPEAEEAARVARDAERAEAQVAAGGHGPADNDLVLAQQLQNEEYERDNRAHQQEQSRRPAPASVDDKRSKRKDKAKDKCLIM